MLVKTGWKDRLGVLRAVLLCGIVLAMPTSVPAQQAKATAVEGVSYNVSSSMADNLKSLAGKKVSITLTSGKSLSGIVKEVGSRLVQLEKLEGKEYFDALILIDQIEAIETRFRGEPR